ncbi:cysteine hydrolase family protein [Streptomyces odontomachi]|uniref:cysteine hydrolase family protein n=1 Tax=Streptomyces odontomachi TaxID=2944940 RepID=UPI00210ADD50|nr:cysteine hydrolase [Streptomyces sp. ODS25]
MTTSEPVVDARRMALLVMDYQVSLVPMLPAAVGAEDLVRRVADAIGTVRRAGGAVAYVRTGLVAAERAAVPAENAHVRAFIEQTGPAMDADGPGTVIVDALAPQADDIVVRKIRVGGFSTTDLHDRLAERGVTTLVLAGIATGGVVLSTVREAADRDYRLLVLSDGCADPDPQVHETLMEKVFPQQAQVLQVAELARVLA